MTKSLREISQALLDNWDTVEWNKLSKRAELMAELRAALAEATPESIVSGWQDISTAPKDGSNVLAWCDLWGGYHIVHWDESECAWVEGSWVFGTGPTDWKPIDPPPYRAALSATKEASDANGL